MLWNLINKRFVSLCALALVVLLVMLQQRSAATPATSVLILSGMAGYILTIWEVSASPHAPHWRFAAGVAVALIFTTATYLML
ncbi:MAG: hypothetical protein WAX89_06155 [Alphaproteobacteria bacterium]